MNPIDAPKRNSFICRSLQRIGMFPAGYERFFRGSARYKESGPDVCSFNYWNEEAADFLLRNFRDNN